MESRSSFIPTLAPGESYSQITKTRLDLTITQSTFDQGKRAFNQEQYDQAIDYYTQALQALHKHVVSIILLHRAAAYEMDSKFDEAKQDCEYALTHAKATCPDVYFSYGSACYFTDHWDAALAAYREGIANVPRDIPQHTALVQKHDRLAKQVDQRNQKLVRKLPFEVIHNILSRVSMVDRMQFAQTCRFWNRWLMHEYPYMWYEINGTDLTKPMNTTIDWIPQHCVKNVVLDLTPSITIRYDGEAYNDDEKASLLRFLSNKAHTNDWTNLHLLRGSEVIFNTMHKWKCIESLGTLFFLNMPVRMCY
ncbi:hypothetical protein BJV82DRAFT_363886 [Fennellomyces sp. T-0311]|nr:hypothetical protein BJV82DRAFT_363886 [Fennellomyces sp. T-0311]